MVNKKLLSYAIILVGVIVIILSFTQIQKAIKLTLPAFLTPNVLMIIGVIVLAVGSFILVKAGSKDKLTDVPIYHGEKVVGYRRINNN
jgi:hypothetical protein